MATNSAFESIYLLLSRDDESNIKFDCCRAGAPSFIQKPAIKQLDGGKRILFECKIQADPKPVCTWFRDIVKLSDGGKSSVVFANYI